VLPVVLALALAACVGDDGRTGSQPTPAPTVAPTFAADQTAVPADGVTGAAYEGGLIGSGTTAASMDDPRPAPPLVGLVKADASPFDLADLAGHPALVFFGYTHCPDVCPTTIGTLFEVLAEHPEARAVFVSVDPERDTPEFLAGWTEYFPEAFIGVTGSPGAIRRAADAYGVKYARVETSSRAGYTMSHTANVFLIDGDGQLRGSYPFGTGPDAFIADLSRLPDG